MNSSQLNRSGGRKPQPSSNVWHPSATNTSPNHHSFGPNVFWKCSSHSFAQCVCIRKHTYVLYMSEAEPRCAAFCPLCTAVMFRVSEMHKDKYLLSYVQPRAGGKVFHNGSQLWMQLCLSRAQQEVRVSAHTWSAIECQRCHSFAIWWNNR